MTRERANAAVCFIGGAGHSGSTLLGLILGSHPDAFYGGEIKEDNVSHRWPPCRRCGPDCPIWRDVKAEPTPDVYEALSRRTGKPLVVDSAKGIERLQGQIEYLRRAEVSVSLLFLQRDGRAVINSRMRKRPHVPTADHIAHWVRQITDTVQFFDGFPGKKLKVRYEALATNPEGVVRQICDVLGIEYLSGMLEFHHHEHHPLGGNIGTHSVVIRAQSVDNPLVRLKRKNADHYSDHPPEIRLDLRWQAELPEAAAALFEVMAGDVNREMRWETDAA